MQFSVLSFFNSFTFSRKNYMQITLEMEIKLKLCMAMHLISNSIIANITYQTKPGLQSVYGVACMMKIFMQSSKS